MLPSSAPLPGLAGEFCFHMVKLGSQRITFYVCREYILRIISLTELTGQDVGLMASLFYCLGASLMLLLHGFTA